MAKKTSIVVATIIAISSLGAVACESHPWFDPPPRTLFSFKGATYSFWPVLPDMVATAAAKLESTPYVVITPMESAHLSGQSYFDDIPGHLLLLRGLKSDPGVGFGVNQEGEATLVFSSPVARNGTAIPWPVVAKLRNLPSHVYVACFGMAK